MTSTVAIIGVTHRDPAVPRTLLKVLRRERPGRVIVEMSRASLLYRRGAGREWAERIRGLLARTDRGTARAREAEELLAVLALPGELRAALRFVGHGPGHGHGHGHGHERPKIILADLSKHAIPKLEEIDAWAGEVVERLERGREPLPFPARARGAAAVDEFERAAADERERFAASVVRKAVRANPEARIAYVCGHEHVAPLARLLRDLRPRKMTVPCAMLPCT